MIELDELLAALKIWIDDRDYYRESNDVYNAYRKYKAATPPLVLEAVGNNVRKETPPAYLSDVNYSTFIDYKGQCYRLPKEGE